jgi:PPOX class probable F420-dependent enzyme
VRIGQRQARELFAAARVARLATVSPDGRPHLVPIVFAVEGDTIYSVVDAKPKRTTSLQRLANIVANPAVSVLVDEYREDWTQLWWARADGTARVLADPTDAISLLATRYPQYRAEPPPGPAIAITVNAWSGWVASAPDLGGRLDDQR